MISNLIAFGISFLISLPVSIMWVYLIDNVIEKTNENQNEKSI
jgi:hypothetical protein